ncbi:hypothetical protein EGW08_014511, partial [Elysia chlorotica]
STSQLASQPQPQPLPQPQPFNPVQLYTTPQPYYPPQSYYPSQPGFSTYPQVQPQPGYSTYPQSGYSTYPQSGYSTYPQPGYSTYPQIQPQPGYSTYPQTQPQPGYSTYPQVQTGYVGSSSITPEQLVQGSSASMKCPAVPVVAQASPLPFGGQAFNCPAPNGKFVHPSSCEFYYFCLFQMPFRERCPAFSQFNPYRQDCECIATSTYVCPSLGVVTYQGW